MPLHWCCPLNTLYCTLTRQNIDFGDWKILHYITEAASFLKGNGIGGDARERKIATIIRINCGRGEP